MNLSEKNYITKGTRRSIYLHPENPDLCVKIPKEINREVRREINYINRYGKKLPFLSLFHGQVETNLGTGYIFDLIKNEDGSIASTLSEEHASKPLPLLKEKISLLHSALLKHGACVADFHSRNIVVRWLTQSEYELYVVDGFGNSDFIKICNISKSFLKRKLQRKFNRLLKSLNLPTDA